MTTILRTPLLPALLSAGIATYALAQYDTADASSITMNNVGRNLSYTFASGEDSTTVSGLGRDSVTFEVNTGTSTDTSTVSTITMKDVWHNLTYTFTASTGSATVSYLGRDTVISEVVIPDTYTGTGDDGRTRTVTITNIGSFSASPITKVIIRANRVAIGSAAFKECTSLSSVTVEGDGSISAIGENAFYGCTSLTSIDLPEGLRTIGGMAFNGDEKLASVKLPSTTQSIGDYAFAGSGLAEVAIPKSVSSLSQYCFQRCTSLKKVCFEGGGSLTEIPMNAFAYCSSLEELTIPDSVRTIRGGAFLDCTSLRSLTLPNSTEEIQWQALQCPALDTLKLYAVEMPTYYSGNGGTFTGMPAGQVTLLVPDKSIYADWSSYFKAIGNAFSFTAEETAEGDTPKISAADEATVLDVFRALSDTKGYYTGATVDLRSDILFNATELGLDTMSASNIYTVLDAFPTVGSYAGTLNGATISNMAMRSTGLFGTIAEGAAIDGLVLEDAVLYVDPTDAGTYEVDGDSVTIHVLARTSNGKVTNVGFSGDIIVDSDLADGKDISACLVNETSEDSELNGYIRIGSLLGTGSSKRCITIKQNLGVKRPKGTLKMATSKSLDSGNKTLTGSFNYTEEELMKSVREFSDEEFAQGAVAYWLNYSGPGYTGDYTARWSQGKRVPVSATTVNGVSNALYAVDYGQTDLSHITSAPQFANNGSKITIVYDQKPAQVTVGGQAVTSYGEKSVTLTFDHTKPVSIAFSTSTTALPDAVQPAKAAVSVSGMCVTVTGAEGQAKTLYSMTGRKVASTNGESLTAPGKGLYLLSVGGKTHRLLIK